MRFRSVRAGMFLVVTVFTTTMLAQQSAPPAQAPLIARAEAIVDALAARQFAKVFAQFDATMKQGIPEEKMPGVWDSIQAQAGAFVKRTGSLTEVRGGYTVVVVSCDFERAKANVVLTFNGEGEIAGLQVRPAQPNATYVAPEYATTSAYTETEVTVGAQGWPLAGTLTMPAGAGPFPAVVLVHGSGPNDRDESFGPNKTFKDLALGLGSRGVAVLRYDKRTKVHASRVAALHPFTVRDEAIDDAVAAVAFLRRAPRIDPRKVYVLGHSLGGTVAPRIADVDPMIAGLIVMAGAVRPLERAIVEQMTYLADADGKVTEPEQRALDDARKLADTVGKLTAEDLKSTTSLGGAPASYWLDLRGYDPAKHAASLKVRMLILQGERDYQVTMGDFGQWKSALSGRKDVEFRSYSALNHLFLPGQGKSLPPEYMLPGHVAIEVITDIVSWIKGQ